MDELGAESLDFLDIVFKLERAFDIQITRGEMERAARGTMSEEEFAPKGVISEAGLASLRELMPEAAAPHPAGTASGADPQPVHRADLREPGARQAPGPERLSLSSG